MVVVIRSDYLIARYKLGIIKIISSFISLSNYVHCKGTCYWYNYNINCVLTEMVELELNYYDKYSVCLIEKSYIVSYDKTQKKSFVLKLKLYAFVGFACQGR